MRIREAFAHAQALGVARLDAQLLLAHHLRRPRAWLLAHDEDALDGATATAVEDALARRAAGEPLAYVLGEAEFRGLALAVSPAVLIPRPETELLLEAALEHFHRGQALRLLDVCTGSGCVAVGLAREFPKGDVIASDISEEALDVARRNVARYGLASRVRCVHADLLAGLPRPFDLIVANPPYIPAADEKTLQPEVRDFEPSGALFAGSDGLRIVRRLITEAAQALAPDGILIFEFGAGQDAAIEQLIDAEPALTLLEVKHDLQDIPRAAVVRKA